LEYRAGQAAELLPEPLAALREVKMLPPMNASCDDSSTIDAMNAFVRTKIAACASISRSGTSSRRMPRPSASSSVNIEWISRCNSGDSSDARWQSRATGAMLREEIEERVDQIVEERAERRARREVADDRVARAVREATEDGVPELLLASPVIVEGAERHARAARDLARGGAGVAVLGKHLLRGVEIFAAVPCGSNRAFSSTSSRMVI
jgi:hypothetical protein